MQTIDARGKPCPQPVIMTRQAMAQAQELRVLVSSSDSANNVRRLAEKAGWEVAVEQAGEAYSLTLRKTAPVVEPVATPGLEQACTLPPRAVVLITGTELGRGSQELGTLLLSSYLYALSEVEVKPQTLVFMNAGVTLATTDSPVLEALQKLAGQGVELLVCGTCLGYYELRDKLAVGSVSNMYSIAEVLLNAGHTITI